MISPCRSCELLTQDKNDPECQECDKRIAYIKSMGHEALPSGVVITTFKPKKQEAPMMKIEKQPTGKICTRCKIEKPLTDYTHKRKEVDGLDRYCRECKSIIMKEYRSKNKSIKTTKKIKPARPIIDPITDNVHMVNLGPIFSKLETHINETKKIIQFLEVLKQTTGATFQIPKLEVLS